MPRKILTSIAVLLIIAAPKPACFGQVKEDPTSAQLRQQLSVLQEKLRAATERITELEGEVAKYRAAEEAKRKYAELLTGSDGGAAEARKRLEAWYKSAGRSLPEQKNGAPPTKQSPADPATTAFDEDAALDKLLEAWKRDPTPPQPKTKARAKRSLSKAFTRLAEHVKNDKPSSGAALLKKIADVLEEEKEKDPTSSEVPNAESAIQKLYFDPLKPIFETDGLTDDDRKKLELRFLLIVAHLKFL